MLAEKFIRKICNNVIEKGLPENTFLNINIPNCTKIKGIEIARQGKRIYRDKMMKKTDPRGKSYYWLGGKEPGFVREKGTDFSAIQNKKISITPLKFDFTNFVALDSLKELIG